MRGPPGHRRGGEAFSSSHPPFLRLTVTTLAVRNSAITDAKNTTSRKSITPAEIAAKWVTKLKDEIAWTNASGAQPVKKSITSGAPEIVNRKHTTTLTTNAITWLEVVAEMQLPI